MKERTRFCFALGLVLTLVMWTVSVAQDSTDEAEGAGQGAKARGTFKPVGKPPRAPLKIDAGKGCIVEIVQSYEIIGTLSGSLEIDYRIMVLGPCGSPAGTFDEEWIAHGKFTGTVNGTAASARLSYLARVHAGGDVEGLIVLGQGVDGELRISGNFGDGKLSYEGSVK